MSEPRQRLFFALWPDAAASKQQQALLARLRFSGRRIPPPSQHLTLHFLGDVTAGQGVRLKSDLRCPAVGGFDLVWDRLVYRVRQRMIWLAGSQFPDALFSLHRGLAVALKDLGHEVECREWLPHVTLARKVGGFESIDLDPPLVWRVSELSLVRSYLNQRGARYQTVCRWPLGR